MFVGGIYGGCLFSTHTRTTLLELIYLFVLRVVGAFSLLEGHLSTNNNIWLQVGYFVDGCSQLQFISCIFSANSTLAIRPLKFFLPGSLGEVIRGRKELQLFAQHPGELREALSGWIKIVFLKKCSLNVNYSKYLYHQSGVK